MVTSLYAKQLLAFLTLVGVQSTAILLFKLCQVNGKYNFSPSSSVALTEICKLALAISLHYYSLKGDKRLFDGVSMRMVVHYFGLSAMYTINNQLSFYVLMVADPGSLALGKSVAPYLCALLLQMTGQLINKLQWVCVIIQCCAIAIIQYDTCKNRGVLTDYAYILIAVSTTITALTSVWNQLVIKGFDVPVNLQNAIMYLFSSLIAIGFFFHEQHAQLEKKQLGFFEGYETLAMLLVLFQAFHGIAVAFVYKYADAIVKNFAASSVVALLFVISAYFFQQPTNLHSWCGIIIVLVTTYCYMNIALKLDSPAQVPGGIKDEKERLLEEAIVAESIDPKGSSLTTSDR
uniref:Sugar phosphate transporter domain-containing protein n=1 Tax=Coccolithus braarudii TaxID=221442 RepID=A0A7S0LQF7_9EUKA|eukprot:CAMPEP_0183359100 /NCGR_PEP_ID=MMETSP0164_2-20130417/51217_1 /TAXON_ID=221442 /ORGANISM="Coccolithus pelagicus ssp braarudi, Strain PLY182g" /LENGTH=346 /DNA_ID=CAMNT_0025533141 /DNA_START=19 /DNA_END=1059 /DNA_ORIENTATION=-